MGPLQWWDGPSSGVVWQSRRLWYHASDTVASKKTLDEQPFFVQLILIEILKHFKRIPECKLVALQTVLQLTMSGVRSRASEYFERHYNQSSTCQWIALQSVFRCHWMALYTMFRCQSMALLTMFLVSMNGTVNHSPGNEWQCKPCFRC